jgi:hypothetical protein
MRSQAVFDAKEAVGNRYQLCQLTAKTTRRIHVPASNTQDTINSALERIAADLPAGAVKPE